MNPANRRQKSNSIVWLADRDSPHVVRWQKAFESKGIQLIILSLPKRRPRFLYLKDVWRIQLQIRHLKPSVVHAHYASSYGVVMSLLFIQCRRVISVWGSDVLVLPNKNALFKYLVKRALLKADVRLANSGYLAGDAEKLSGVPFTPVPFGVDTKALKHTKRHSNFSNRPFYIGINKRLHMVAGIDILLEAFQLVSGELPEFDVRLVVMGAGPEELALKELAKKLCVSSKVSWLGWCDEKRISSELSKVDLAVFPSRVEGLGVSVLEAMACGVPVISSKVGGLVGLIGESETRGAMFDLNKNSLSATIVHSISYYEQTLVKSLLAREFVEQDYDLSKNVDTLMKIYDN